MPLAVGNCPLNQIHEFRRKDRLSHFILRLAFSQSIVREYYKKRLLFVIFLGTLKLVYFSGNRIVSYAFSNGKINGNYALFECK